MTHLQTVIDEDTGVTIALIVRHGYKSEGVEFLTKSEHSLQVAHMTRSKGNSITAHYHNHNPRTVDRTAEVLFIKKGKLKSLPITYLPHFQNRYLERFQTFCLI